MAVIEIEVFNRGKTTRQGRGFIQDVATFRTSERPNSAAQWSFTVPSEIAMASSLVNGNEAYGYTWIRGSRHCLFGGEILDVRETDRGDGGVDLEVNGLGLLNELNYEYIDSAEVKEAVSTKPIQVFDLEDGVDRPNMYDGNTGTATTIDFNDLVEPNDKWLYICYPAPFWQVSFTIGTGNTTQAATLKAQYYGEDGWTALSITDGTAVSGMPMRESGVVSWTSPTDWQQVLTGVGGDVQGCWVRFGSSPGITTEIQDISLTAWGANTSDLNTLFTTLGYNGGLTLDNVSGTFDSTTDGYYGAFENITALAAYRQLADADGEGGVFRIKTHDTRVFSYLRDAGWTTNYYAVGPSAPSIYGSLPSNQMLITGFTEQKDSRRQINRLYVYGSGNGKDAKLDLSLADATAFASAHSGYTLNTANSYIENTASVAAVGVKAAGKTFPEVRTIDGTENSPEASEQLARLGYAHLAQHVAAVEHLRLELVQMPAPLRAGDKINVNYRRVGANGNIISVAGEYMITDVRHRPVNGVLVAECTASTINRPPVGQNEVLMQTIEQLKREGGHPQRIKAQHISGRPPKEA